MSVEIELRWDKRTGIFKRDYQEPWRKWDIDFLKNQKAMSKTHRGLSNLAYNFNFLLLLSKTHHRPAAAIEQIKIDPNTINVVYAHNVSTDANWMPMTPWIMVHRIAHALISNSSIFDDTYTTMDGPEAALFFGLEDIWVNAFAAGSKPPFTGPKDHRRLVENPARISNYFSCISGYRTDHIGFLATYLFTMKSARERMISNELDIFAEVLAQFFITGTFRLNRWNESGLAELRHTSNYQKNPCSQTDWGAILFTDLTPIIPIEEINAKIEALESTVNTKLRELADRLVGSVVAF